MWCHLKKTLGENLGADLTKYRGDFSFGAISEKSIVRQQAGRVRRAKNKPPEPSDLAGACPEGNFFESMT
jgi:hypothetical protein